MRTLTTRLATLALLIALPFSGCSSSRTLDQNAQALQAILSTEFTTTDGDSITLDSLHGKVVLVHFLASWCAECALEVPSLKTLNRNFDSKDLAIIGVATDDDPVEAKAFVTRTGASFPVIMDTSGELKRFFSVRQLPASLFLDRTGNPVLFTDPATGKTSGTIVGARKWDTAQPVEMIAGLISE